HGGSSRSGSAPLDHLQTDRPEVTEAEISHDTRGSTRSPTPYRQHRQPSHRESSLLDGGLYTPISPIVGAEGREIGNGIQKRVRRRVQRQGVPHARRPRVGEIGNVN